jgi:multicomponent Na+:H+ antiporter subunit B
MNSLFPSNILQFFVRIILVPVIMLFGLYVVAHGEETPGGGFQGGAMMAAGIILARLTLAPEQDQRVLSSQMAVVLAITGALIAVAVGMAPMFAGGNFLDYGALPIPVEDGQVLPHFGLRAFGIAVFEVGIAMAVMSIIVTIFDYLAGFPNDS